MCQSRVSFFFPLLLILKPRRKLVSKKSAATTSSQTERGPGPAPLSALLAFAFAAPAVERGHGVSRRSQERRLGVVAVVVARQALLARRRLVA